MHRVHGRDCLRVSICGDLEGSSTQQLLDRLEVFAIGFHQEDRMIDYYSVLIENHGDVVISTCSAGVNLVFT